MSSGARSPRSASRMCCSITRRRCGLRRPHHRKPYSTSRDRSCPTRGALLPPHPCDDVRASSVRHGEDMARALVTIGVRRHQQPTMNQCFGSGWNIQNENGFDAVSKQLNLCEGQETSGQRHDYPSISVPSSFRVQDIGSFRGPQSAWAKLSSSTVVDNTIKCHFGY